MREAHEELRKLIDAQDATALNDYLTANPDLDLNKVTANGCSALWYAVNPQKGKKISDDVIKVLITTNRVDPTIAYSGLKLSAQSDLIKHYEGQYAGRNPRQNVAAPDNQLQLIAEDAQNTHNSVVVAAIDASIVKLAERYGVPTPAEIQAEITKLDALIKNISEKLTAKINALTAKSPKIEQEGRELNSLNALKKSLDDSIFKNATLAVNRINANTITRPYNVKGVNYSLTNAAVLALMLRAAADQAEDAFVKGATQSDNETMERQICLIKNLAKTQTEYSAGNPACWMGTRNGMVSSLDKIHGDIAISDDSALTPELIVMKYRAYCKTAIENLEKGNNTLFYDYLKHYPLRDLPGGFNGGNTDIPANASEWVQATQAGFLKAIEEENRSNGKQFPENELAGCPCDIKIGELDDNEKNLCGQGRKIFFTNVEDIFRLHYRDTEGSYQTIDLTGKNNSELIKLSKSTNSDETQKELRKIARGLGATMPISAVATNLFEDLTYTDADLKNPHRSLYDAGITALNELVILLGLADSQVKTVQGLLPKEKIKVCAEKGENNETIEAKISKLKKTLIDDVNLALLYAKITTPINDEKNTENSAVSGVKTVLDNLNEDDKNSLLKAYWPEILDSFIENTSTKPPEKILWEIVQKGLEKNIPVLSSWLAGLPDDIRFKFLLEISNKLYISNFEKHKNNIKEEALQLASDSGYLKNFTFDETYTVTERDLRGSDLSDIDLSKITFKNCNLCLTGIEEKLSEAQLITLIENGNVFNAHVLEEKLKENPYRSTLFIKHCDTIVGCEMALITQFMKGAIPEGNVYPAFKIIVDVLGGEIFNYFPSASKNVNYGLDKGVFFKSIVNCPEACELILDPEKSLSPYSIDPRNSHINTYNNFADYLALDTFKKLEFQLLFSQGENIKLLLVKLPDFKKAPWTEHTALDIAKAVFSNSDMIDEKSIIALNNVLQNVYGTNLVTLAKDNNLLLHATPKSTEAFLHLYPELIPTLNTLTFKCRKVENIIRSGRALSIRDARITDEIEGIFPGLTPRTTQWNLHHKFLTNPIYQKFHDHDIREIIAKNEEKWNDVKKEIYEGRHRNTKGFEPIDLIPLYYNNENYTHSVSPKPITIEANETKESIIKKITSEKDSHVLYAIARSKHVDHPDVKMALAKSVHATAGLLTRLADKTDDVELLKAIVANKNCDDDTKAKIIFKKSVDSDLLPYLVKNLTDNKLLYLAAKHGVCDDDIKIEIINKIIYIHDEYANPDKEATKVLQCLIKTSDKKLLTAIFKEKPAACFALFDDIIQNSALDFELLENLATIISTTDESNFKRAEKTCEEHHNKIISHPYCSDSISKIMIQDTRGINIGGTKIMLGRTQDPDLILNIAKKLNSYDYGEVISPLVLTHSFCSTAAMMKAIPYITLENFPKNILTAFYDKKISAKDRSGQLTIVSAQLETLISNHRNKTPAVSDYLKFLLIKIKVLAKIEGYIASRQSDLVDKPTPLLNVGLFGLKRNEKTTNLKLADAATLRNEVLESGNEKAIDKALLRGELDPKTASTVKQGTYKDCLSDCLKLLNSPEEKPTKGLTR